MRNTRIFMAVMFIAGIFLYVPDVSQAFWGKPANKAQPVDQTRKAQYDDTAVKAQSGDPAEKAQPDNTVVKAQPVDTAVNVQSDEPAQKESGDIETRYANLVKEFNALKADRDNVLAQTKRLLEGKSKLAGLEEMQAKWEAETQALGEKNKELSAGNMEKEASLQQLKAAQARLEDETMQLKKENESLQKGTVVAELKEKIAALEKEQAKAVAEVKKEYEPLRKYMQEAEENIKRLKNEKEETLKKKQAEIDLIKKDMDKAKFRIDELDRRKAEDKKRNDEALRKNKAMENAIKNMPRKFSEIARQNKMLVKETGQMHYNLGVFYTKNQEYERALSEFKKSVEINSDNAAAYFNLGYIYAEYLVNRKKAIENFRHYLQVSKGGDKDTDWVKKYLLTWDTYDGKDPIY